MIKKVKTNMDRLLSAYGVERLLIVVNAIMSAARLKAHYAILNQLDQKEASIRNSRCSQQSDSVSCERRCHFSETCLIHGSL
jgi:hypothetical protein